MKLLILFLISSVNLTNDVAYGGFMYDAVYTYAHAFKAVYLNILIVFN